MNTTLKRFCIVVVFGTAFAYIEAAVVVYLRTIFHPYGFTFPLTEFGISSLWKRLLLIEVGREAATLLLIFTGAWLFAKNRQQRFAYFATIFAVWDIFYYLWLKTLINWPVSPLEWDILFLIPFPWAGPVLAPVIVSITLLVFGAVVLYRSSVTRDIKVSALEQFVFVLAGLVVVVSFWIAGRHIAQPNFKEYFYWPLFALGELIAIVFFLRCCLKQDSTAPV
jgi:hypothetical protein